MIKRKGVAALHLHLKGVRIPRIGVQWPAAAMRDGGALNLSTITGGIETSDRDPEEAMLREFEEEYRCNVEFLASLFKLAGPRKEFEVFCAVTGWRINPNPEEVGAFAWVRGPDELQYVLKAMSELKQEMILSALELSARLHFPQLCCYEPLWRR